MGGNIGGTERKIEREGGKGGRRRDSKGKLAGREVLKEEQEEYEEAEGRRKGRGSGEASLLLSWRQEMRAVMTQHFGNGTPQPPTPHHLTSPLHPPIHALALTPSSTLYPVAPSALTPQPREERKRKRGYSEIVKNR